MLSIHSAHTARYAIHQHVLSHTNVTDVKSIDFFFNSFIFVNRDKNHVIIIIMSLFLEECMLCTLDMFAFSAYVKKTCVLMVICK